MNCEILRTLYVKSNGDILCNDDCGERILLGKSPDTSNPENIKNVFDNEQYSIIRNAFLSDQIPWKGVCENCAFFRPEEKFSDLLAQRKIEKLQLEPSLACNLSCPACSNSIQIKTRSKPHLMDPADFEVLVCSLRENNYEVDWIEYCGQGEPLMHPKFSEFVSIARKYLPKTKQRLITNGNFEYEKVLGGTYLDEIFVSCDGVRQSSYEQYRIRGNSARALKFLEDIPTLVNGLKQQIVWKYILFEFNDSDEELIEAQKLAQTFSVDTLLFVITHSEFRSIRYTLGTIGNLPILFANVHTNAHPSFYKRAYFAKRLPRKDRFTLRRISKPSFEACIDDVFWFPENTLQLRGWGGAVSELSNVEIYCNGNYLGTGNLIEEREDVKSSYLNFHKSTGGFRMSCAFTGERPSDLEFRIKLMSSTGKEIGEVIQNFIWN